MKLTGRQEAFIRNMLDLSRELNGPIHYSVLAERMGVSPITAYDMLRFLEEKGLVTSQYQRAAGKSRPGRSAVVFVPTRRASQPMAQMKGVPADDWEATKELLLENVRKRDGPDCELARELLARCPGLMLTYDPSHYIAERIPVSETLDLLDHAAHIHLRNARPGHFQERMRKGRLDVGWMVDQVLASGYRGAISIEYIQDCGGLQEGYEVRDEAQTLVQLLLDRGLAL